MYQHSWQLLLFLCKWFCTEYWWKKLYWLHVHYSLHTLNITCLQFCLKYQYECSNLCRYMKDWWQLKNAHAKHNLYLVFFLKPKWIFCQVHIVSDSGMQLQYIVSMCVKNHYPECIRILLKCVWYSIVAIGSSDSIWTAWFQSMLCILVILLHRSYRNHPTETNWSP